MQAPGPILLERGWLSANSIVFPSGNQVEGAVVVDTGHLAHAPQTLALLHEALSGSRLGAVLNTHLHSDHCGGNSALQAASDAPIWIPPGQASAVAAWNEEQLSYRPTGQRCDRFRYQCLLEPGQELILGNEPWQVLAAPGHDPDAVILHAPESGRLISGDALWQEGFGVVFQALEGPEGFDAALAVLDLIESLQVREVFPGHGPAFSAVSDAIAQARQRLVSQRAQPERHARYAIKVLVSFCLLDRRAMSREQLRDYVQGTPLISRYNAQAPKLPPEELVDWLVEELVKAGAARWDGQTLVAR
jgi:glyoxylase-like metal-dependent hydrolase (beta-lactamase superfamily II)